MQGDTRGSAPKSRPRFGDAWRGTRVVVPSRRPATGHSHPGAGLSRTYGRYAVTASSRTGQRRAGSRPSWPTRRDHHRDHLSWGRPQTPQGRPSSAAFRRTGFTPPGGTSREVSRRLVGRRAPTLCPRSPQRGGVRLPSSTGAYLGRPALGAREHQRRVERRASHDDHGDAEQLQQE